MAVPSAILLSQLLFYCKSGARGAAYTTACSEQIAERISVKKKMSGCPCGKTVGPAGQRAFRCFGSPGGVRKQHVFPCATRWNTIHKEQQQQYCRTQQKTTIFSAQIQKISRGSGLCGNAIVPGPRACGLYEMAVPALPNCTAPCVTKHATQLQQQHSVKTIITKYIALTNAWPNNSWEQQISQLFLFFCALWCPA